MRRIDWAFAPFRRTGPRHRVLRAEAVRVIHELSPGDGANELFHRFSHICLNFRGITRPQLLPRLENPSFKPTQAPRHGSAAVSRTPIIGPEGEMRQGLWTPKCAAFGRKTRGRMSCGHTSGWTRCGTRRRSSGLAIPALFYPTRDELAKPRVQLAAILDRQR